MSARAPVPFPLPTRRHAFAADSLLSLVYQIAHGSHEPLPEGRYSRDLASLVDHMLTKDPEARPSLHQLLALPYVQTHLQRFNMQERQRVLEGTASLARRAGSPRSCNVHGDGTEAASASSCWTAVRVGVGAWGEGGGAEGGAAQPPPPHLCSHDRPE